ncbi:MAG: UDP-N-acetylmuramoyl-L-alanyl-D-glutamate--2,6-diaminopimelate ligase [Bacteroidales bacterium]|nr:UDP-N-acetylmuramoyl-L-alanyl-D-glutamate--2,6-diaminopimelate ligase [Bacteroidales bacterium]
MKLEEILKGIDYKAYYKDEECAALPAFEVDGVVFDSRRAGAETLFVAQRGVHTDGHLYIPDVVAAGCRVVMCETLPKKMSKQVLFVQVADASQALGLAAANFYGNPSHKLKLIGITGTNGKTTTVTLLHRLFRTMGHHTGLLSTIVNRIDDEEIPATHTTPDAVELNSLLARMVEAGCDYCFMEVSSHALVQHRVEGLQFAGAIFSNITHDHLDFHGNMANYIAAKKMLFDNLPESAFALTNVDDRNGMVMVQNCKAKIHTYSLMTLADFHTKIMESTFQGQQLVLNGKEFWTPLVGRFNAYNITAIAATAMLCGCPQDEALRLVSGLHAAPGRFQYLHGGGITAIVDYAHTPDALKNVLETINEVRQPQQNLIVVVGCGGDRDPLKRPIMAKIAYEHCNHLILTSDNPRTEDPMAILKAMEGGLDDEQRSNVVSILDRRQAIRTATLMAREGDIILVAGKGHETYQEINGVRHHFDDREELAALLEEKNNNPKKRK